MHRRHVVLIVVLAVLAMVLATEMPRARADGWASIVTPPPTGQATCVPSPRQLAYQEKQLGAFVHFGLPTYAVDDAEYAAVFPWNPDNVPDVSRFNPTQLDAEQWVLAAKSFGAKHVVFPAKHHDGFCLWPTKTSDYSVRSTPWKNGKGDIVREVADACKKHGLGFGVYCSPADKHYGCYSSRPTFADPPTHVVVGDRDAYFAYYKEQLTELLTNYGDVVMVWFDCYGDPFDAKVTDKKTGRVIGERKYDEAIMSLIRSLQPGAVVLRYWTVQSDLRPVGGEDGTAPYPVWNVVRKGGVGAYDKTLSGTLPPEAEGWYFCESDLPTRPQWIWRPNSDGQLLSVDRLLAAYYHSIGRGSNILINLTPDPRVWFPMPRCNAWPSLGRTATPLRLADCANRQHQGLDLAGGVGAWPEQKGDDRACGAGGGHCPRAACFSLRAGRENRRPMETDRPRRINLAKANRAI